MTVPFGFLFPLTQSREKRTFRATVLMTLLLSLIIEVFQPIINGDRSFDVTDLITNTLGGMIGYMGYVVIRPVIGSKRNGRSNERDY